MFVRELVHYGVVVLVLAAFEIVVLKAIELSLVEVASSLDQADPRKVADQKQGEVERSADLELYLLPGTGALD